MSKLRRRGRKRLHVEPAIEPQREETFEELLERYNATSADDLWITCLLSNTSDRPKSGSVSRQPNKFDTPIPRVPEFRVPMRNGKPATIYVWTDPETDTGYEFHDPAEIDDLIKSIRRRYHNHIRRQVDTLSRVKKRLTD